jgi:hypothetical protein
MRSLHPLATCGILAGSKSGGLDFRRRTEARPLPTLIGLLS